MLRYLIQKEFTQIRRNAFLPRLIIVFPIMVMCVLPWVMNMEVKNIVVDVVDLDRSTVSQRLVHDIEQNHYFIFHGQKSTYAEALKDIEHTRADVVVVIPQDYSKDMVNGKQPQVLIAANAVNGTKGAIGSAYLSQIMASYTIVMMLMTGFLPALNIVSEKESGTIEQMNVTPVSKWSFILAKLIPYWIIALFVITVCLLLAWLVYGITSSGPLWLIYLLSMLLALFFSSLGLIISNYSDTMQQAVFVMWFFVVIMLLLSGLFTPTRSMPSWSYLTTYINPVSYFVEAVRTIFIRGGNFLSVWHQVVALSTIATFMGGWAILSYKKNH